MCKKHTIPIWAAYHLLSPYSVILQESELCSGLWRGLDTAGDIYGLNPRVTVIYFQPKGLTSLDTMMVGVQVREDGRY